MKNQESRESTRVKMTNKKCFVIMPFGKEKNAQDTSMAIYRSIIRPAGEEAGYEVTRMDTDSSSVGSITKNIVRSLADADLVIADITGSNANVLYELGIRHALKKCATVMIVEEGEVLPFDLSDYGVTFYSKSLERMERSIRLIVEAIKKSERAEREEQSDNPVFAHYPSIEFRGERDVNDELLAKIDHLTMENSKLRDLLGKNSIPVEESLQKEDLILALLEAADKAVEDSGPNMMLELQKAVTRSDSAVFTANLKKILTGELLTERRLVQISRLCDQMGLIPHRIVVLTEAYSRFPNSYEIVGLLADAYSDHPDINQKRKGREFIEKVMHVRRTEDGKPFADKETVIAEELLMGLFNVYISIEDWDAIISFADSAKGFSTNESDAILTRNIARAYVEKREFEKAHSSLQEAIEAEPENDTLRTMLGELYKKMGENDKALEAQEQAVFLDSDDMNNFINLSIDILNYGFYRDENFVISKHGRRESTEEAISIFKYILEQNSSHGVRSRIVDILTRRGRTKEAEEVLSNGRIDNLSPSSELKYILSKVSVSL